MKYTKQLLSRFVSGSYDLETLSRQLTLQSCEVEEVYERKIPDLVVIGKVISCKKHPDADKLTICQVDCGHLGIFQICTGATNIREQIYVPAALPGCFLSAIHLQIDPRPMRGVESNGMICSKEELGIAEDMGLHGIWILQDSTGTDTKTDFSDITEKELGKPLSEHASWLENRVLDVENKTITHRPDMFGHFGLAREINAMFPEHIRFSRLQSIAEQIVPQTLLHTLHQATVSSYDFHVESPFVGAYSVLELSGVEIKNSSLHLRLHLLDLGLGTRNNRVDFSNYFMYLTGQPIHCFDADQIQGSILVRQAKDKEQFIDLFDAEHTLTEQDIVICDDQGILALAGVVGGKRSGINDSTTHVLIEIAQFDPVVVRKTAMRLGIRTDAQTRFEKHISPGFSLASILLCLDELEYLGKKELGNREMKGVRTWVAPTSQALLSRTVPFEVTSINRMLGVDLSSDEMQGMLTRLGLLLQGNQNILQVPVWRGVDDLHHTADIAEEVARIYGFDAIGSAEYSTPMQAIPFSHEVTTIRETEHLLTAVMGYSQVETYPRLHTRWHDEFPPTTQSCFTMENSMAPELGYLRDTMIPSLLEVVEKNAPFYETMRVYDIGTIWTKQGAPKERTSLTMALVAEKSANRKLDPYLLLKQDVETHLAKYTDLQQCVWTHSTYARGHANQQADLYIGTTLVGTIAHLHPRLIDNIGIETTRTVVVAEIDLGLLTSREEAHTETIAYATLQDQLIWRDVSFVLPRDGNYGQISDALLTVEEIAEVKLLDIYAGSSLHSDEKSISLSFLIRGDGTITNEVINQVMQKAIDAGQAAGARLR